MNAAAPATWLVGGMRPTESMLLATMPPAPMHAPIAAEVSDRRSQPIKSGSASVEQEQQKKCEHGTLAS